MSETLLHDGDVLARRHGALRRITLNRPNALNAVTLDMAVAMTSLLRDWASDPAVGAVLLDGAGERGFCAGGDIRALYDAAKMGDTKTGDTKTGAVKTGDSLPARFWATEYKLNVLIARYPKPVVVVMDGLVMGGGVGLSAHAGFRVVTERSAIAMPEVQIGFFPDVGACYLLSRAPGYVGTYLALTGHRIGAADAIYCNLADTHIAADRLSALPTALADCRSNHDVRTRLGELVAAPAPARLPRERQWIDGCFGAADVEEIVERLQASSDEKARAAREAMRKASPTSLKVALRNLRSAATFNRVEESFAQDYRIALACVAGHDFIEGIRAAIVDKDRNPRWQPDKIEAVTPDLVDRHFRRLGALELTFED
ncbi:MAG: enoyl-CoA hydratase/isomerase family protein [Xanthobacteraceae bacterium]